MRILLVSRSFPHHRAGGMEWHAQDIAEGLMARGHEVSVLTTPLPKEPALAPLRINGNLLIAGRKPGRYDPQFLLECRRRLPRAIGDLKPDIIHAQGYTGVMLAPYIAGIAPMVTTIHGTMWSETPLRRGTIHPLSRRLRLYWRFKHRIAADPFWRKFLQARHHIIVDSAFTAQELRSEGYSGPDPVIVPLGFDLERFPLADRVKARKILGIDTNAILLVALGRLEETKRPHWIARGFQEVSGGFPAAQLLIGGEGKMRRRLEAVARTSDRMRLPGRIDPKDVPGLLQAADLFVNLDGGAPAFGLANAEALVMGTPVIASDNGAHREVLPPESEDSVSRLVEGDDFPAWVMTLRTTLSRLPEEEPQREARASAARTRFNRDAMIERLEACYRRIAGG